MVRSGNYHPYMWSLYPISCDLFLSTTNSYIFSEPSHAHTNRKVIDVYVSLVNIFWTHMFIFLSVLLISFPFYRTNNHDYVTTGNRTSFPRGKLSVRFNDRHWTTIEKLCINYLPKTFNFRIFGKWICSKAFRSYFRLNRNVESL